jgi:hypothetical protein
MTKTPLSGDVIIQRQVHSPAVYVLHTLGWPGQFFHRTYEAAMEQARRFALIQSIDVWYATDASVFKRVAQHRPTPGTGVRHAGTS